MISIAMFPGQGSQYVGMGKLLLDRFPRVRRVFEEVEDTLKINIRKLCFHGPVDHLKLTANTQPCLLSVSLAMWKVLQEESSLTPDYFAGHSLGEYSALVAAEKLSLREAAWLVRKRGEAMQSSVKLGKGKMSAVLNFDATQLSSLCLDLSTKDCIVEVVNFNSPDQQIISGHSSAVDKISAYLKTEKVHVIALPVSAPFHSSLMTPAVAIMKPLLKKAVLHKNNQKVFANFTGDVAAPYHVDYLIQQINHPVKWEQTLRRANQLGVMNYIEIGAGKVLTGLVTRTLGQQRQVINTENLDQCFVALNK